MKRFFANKYPVTYGSTSSEDLRLDVGTIFTIIGISGNMFELEPVRKIQGLDYPLMFDVLMLEQGFTEQDHIPT